MKEIPLSIGGKNKGKYVALVDDETFEFLIQWRWSAQPIDTTIYAVAWVADSDGVKRNTAMHTLLMNTPKGMMVDHKDRNGLNNQKQNLRLCSHKENVRNSRKKIRKGSTSPYKGVCLEKQTSRYRACICCNGKHIWIGRFDTEIEAAIAYNKKAAELYGEFAYLNKLEAA